jgi:NIMA (never in mitosis gene a)-related kinase
LAQTVLTGKYSPIPNTFSKDLSQFIGFMLQLKPKSRPSCEKMLRSPIVLKKIEELGLNDVVMNDKQKELLNTIKMPKKLQYLTDRLPKSNYSFSQSY